MPRTVTVRLSVIVGVFLLIVGGAIFGYGAHEKATYDHRAGISLEPGSLPGENITEFSNLTQDQQGLFLLAVNPGQGGSYWTPDAELQEIAYGMPYHVRYEGNIYTVTSGHTDALVGRLERTFGIVLFGTGLVTLLGATATSLLRRFRG